jgi:hypothetical protein
LSAAGVPHGCRPGGAELERARAAYRAALAEARARLDLAPSARHQDTACWGVLASLFVEPGLSRTALVDRVAGCAGVSRPTAERVVRRAREGGHIVDRTAGRAVAYSLSEPAFERCLDHFRRHMDAGRGSGVRGGEGRP